MEKYSETKTRYIEMIQNVITRMGSNSFLLKGWTVTLIAGIFALASKDADKQFFLIAYIPIILFWLLDAYYLQIERKYCVLYNSALLLDNDKIEMRLTLPKSSAEDKTEYYQSLFSITKLGFYFPSAILVVVVKLLAV